MPLGESKLFILGAGFSKPAGFPLGSELWNEILSRLKYLSGRASKIEEDISDFIEYQNNVYGKTLTPSEINFEEFLGYLDIEHFLRLRGSDTWSSAGNEGTIVVKNLIAEILSELTPDPGKIPEVYLDFTNKLNPGDYVLTFNYDVLLERALEANKKPFRLFPDRLQSVNKYWGELESGEGDTSEDHDVIVLKMHGSIDWFDKLHYSNDINERKKQGLDTPPYHPVFNNADLLQLVELTQGPRFSNDPLRNIYRAKNIKNLNYREGMFLSSPLLLMPSTYKHVYFNKIHNFWEGMNSEGGLISRLVIIGYSFPTYDPYAIQVLYQIVRNFQSEWYQKNYPWVKKEKLVVITKCESELELNEYKQKKLRFVDWSKAILKSDGFDKNANDMIFKMNN